MREMTTHTVVSMIALCGYGIHFWLPTSWEIGRHCICGERCLTPRAWAFGTGGVEN